MRILHIRSRFDPLSDTIAIAQLVRAFGAGVSHDVVAETPLSPVAAHRLRERGGADREIGFPDAFPALAGPPLPGRLQQLGAAMRGYDLVLTHGWGTIDAVLAHTLFGQMLGLPPLVHHEDRLDPVEATKPSRRRAWYRRVALGRTSAVIVPSARLEALALGSWQQAAARVRRIAPGADIATLAAKPRADALPRLIKRKGELWLGVAGDLVPESRHRALVILLDTLPEHWQLVILGEGPESGPIREEALAREVAHRVHLPGGTVDPVTALGLCDLLLEAGIGEPAPALLAAAMAAGLAVIAPETGDAAEMLAPENRALLSPPGNEPALFTVLVSLAGDMAARRALGTANRLRASAHYDAAVTTAAQRAVYAAALGRETFP